MGHPRSILNLPYILVISISKLEKKTIPQLKKLLDKEFSKFIRHDYSEDGINVQCITCHAVKPITSMHNGHWIPRNISPTRYHESNCRPQCPSCNTFKAGMPHIFQQNLRTEIGDYAIDQMIEESRQPWKWDRFWLIDKIEYYKDLNA